MAWLTRDSQNGEWHRLHFHQPREGGCGFQSENALRLTSAQVTLLGFDILEPGGGPVEVELVEAEKYKVFDWYLDQLTELCHKQMAGEKVEYVRIGSPLINRQAALIEQLGEDLDEVRGPAGVWSAVGKMEKKIKAWRAQKDGKEAKG